MDQLAPTFDSLMGPASRNLRITSAGGMSSICFDGSFWFASAGHHRRFLRPMHNPVPIHRSMSWPRPLNRPHRHSHGPSRRDNAHAPPIPCFRVGCLVLAIPFPFPMDPGLFDPHGSVVFLLETVPSPSMGGGRDLAHRAWFVHSPPPKAFPPVVSKRARIVAQYGISPSLRCSPLTDPTPSSSSLAKEGPPSGTPHPPPNPSRSIPAIIERSLGPSLRGRGGARDVMGSHRERKQNESIRQRFDAVSCTRIDTQVRKEELRTRPRTCVSDLKPRRKKDEGRRKGTAGAPGSAGRKGTTLGTRGKRAPGNTSHEGDEERCEESAGNHDGCAASCGTWRRSKVGTVHARSNPSLEPSKSQEDANTCQP